VQVEVGSIVEGKVTGITKFGAFVELPSGKSGMVHISEVSTSFVKEISDHLSENQVVKVKILSVTPEGKIGLSIKKCMEEMGEVPPRPPRPTGQEGQERREGRPPRRHQKDMGWRGFKQQGGGGEMSFEDMMSKFKQTSEDRMSDLKRSTDMRKSTRRGSSK